MIKIWNTTHRCYQIFRFVEKISMLNFIIQLTFCQLEMFNFVAWCWWCFFSSDSVNMILIFVMQATSRLLVNYPQKQRDEILDYLFKVRNLYCKLLKVCDLCISSTLKVKKIVTDINWPFTLYNSLPYIFTIAEMFFTCMIIQISICLHFTTA